MDIFTILSRLLKKFNLKIYDGQLPLFDIWFNCSVWFHRIYLDSFRLARDKATSSIILRVENDLGIGDLSGVEATFTRHFTGVSPTMFRATFVNFVVKPFFRLRGEVTKLKFLCGSINLACILLFFDSVLLLFFSTFSFWTILKLFISRNKSLTFDNLSIKWPPIYFLRPVSYTHLTLPTKA